MKNKIKNIIYVVIFSLFFIENILTTNNKKSSLGSFIYQPLYKKPTSTPKKTPAKKVVPVKKPIPKPQPKQQTIVIRNAPPELRQAFAKFEKELQKQKEQENINRNKLNNACLDISCHCICPHNSCICKHQTTSFTAI